MTTRGFCACCGMPECIIDGTDGRECFHCGDGARTMTTETCRVVLESGAVGSLEVGVTADGWRDVGGRQYHPATPLRAAIAHAAWDRDWPAREILAPGELSAEERVAAERARCAAVCREVAENYSIDDVASRAAAALECAEAIERGAVER